MPEEVRAKAGIIRHSRRKKIHHEDTKARSSHEAEKREYVLFVKCFVRFVPSWLTLFAPTDETFAARPDAWTYYDSVCPIADVKCGTLTAQGSRTAPGAA